LKWNGITSLLKIGGRMLRYEFCPIFINEKMRKKQSNVSEKVWNHQKDVKGKSEFMGKRNVKKNEKQREK